MSLNPSIHADYHCQTQQRYFASPLISKSMSDLNEEKKEEEAHRHQINERYGEMEKLKVLLKEEEDTWTSKLQSWKSRRRSVTEDARKRKEERDSIEKELEHKAAKKKTKTYKEIVEDKMKRDKELAQLNDHDEYEFVSPRSSTVTSPTNSSSYTFEGLVRDVQIREKENKTAATKPSNVYSSREEAPKTNGSQVQYKYTTKVTAVINNTQAENKHASYEAQPQMRSTITYERVPNKSQDNSDVRSTSCLSFIEIPNTASRRYLQLLRSKR
uniref:LIM domain only protein 7-like n=1 Tax=Styela clava TaxID=7725 RepID=UPI001939420C|nr:LIM domain only protein 7-like [Styela clava]